jgi:DNA-binding MarR family transcriptional regulator
MAALIAALEDDPAVRRRRRLITGGVVGVVVASLLVAGQIVRRRHQELERQIAAHVQTASGAAGQARGLAGELRRQRAQAFAAFDARDRERGEALWRQALGRVAAVHGSYERSEQAFERALVLDTGRQDLRARLADVRVEHLLLDDELGLEREASALGARLAGDDADGSRRRALAAPATLVVRVRPATATLTLERYQRDAATAGGGWLRRAGSAGAPPFPWPPAPTGWCCRRPVTPRWSTPSSFRATSGGRWSWPCRRPPPSPRGSCSSPPERSGSAIPTRSCAPTSWTPPPSTGAPRAAT